MDKDGAIKLRTNMLKEVNYLNDWLKSRNPKKMSIKAKDLNEEIQDGVYSSLGGPCYETVTELRGLAQLGADCVGMSTAHEVIFLIKKILII